MKRHGFFLMLLAAAISMQFFSCKSAPAEKIDSVYVMVYDQDSSALMDVSVFAGGKKIGQTDIYGRLCFPFDSEKETEVRIEKPGYETVSKKVFLKPGTVLYFKTGSGTYCAGQAEKLLDENKTAAALKMIDAALKIEKREDYLFLREVILRRL